jgi:hypothetical protein
MQKKNLQGVFTVRHKGSTKRKGNISDAKIHEICGIPLSTMRSWKSKKNDWRFHLYWMLSAMTKDELIALKEKADGLIKKEENENSVASEYSYCILASGLWQKNTKDFYNKTCLPKVKINNEYFDEAWELLHNTSISLKDRIEEVEKEMQ